MPQLHILVSGAGIAGPVLAYWLHRAGAEVTIVERAPAMRSTGQGIDIRGAAVRIIQEMGLEEDVRHHTTTEGGMAFLDTSGREQAVFMATGSTENQSFTSEFEVLRGDLAGILYDTTRGYTNYKFGESIQHIEDFGDKVQVSFATHTQSYDAVIAADGIGSSLRSMVFGSASKEYFHSLHQHMAYFTVKEDLAHSKIGKWYNAPGRRLIMLRPTSAGHTQALLAIVGDSEEVAAAVTADIASQKQTVRKVFSSVGWLGPQVLAAMEHADDFYYQAIAQIKMNTWSQGRVAFVGDAAYCPSPISGMGTTLAITGAYILAGEIARTPNDLPSAFRRYEEILRPYTTKGQQLIPGAPAIANPETQTGITIMLLVLKTVSWFVWLVSLLRIDQAVAHIAAIPAFSSESFAPPKYEWKKTVA